MDEHERPTATIGHADDTITQLLAEHAAMAEREAARRYDDDQAEHAIELLARLADPGPCRYDRRGRCQAYRHAGQQDGEDCPHALARAFLAAARPKRMRVLAKPDPCRDTVVLGIMPYSCVLPAGHNDGDDGDGHKRVWSQSPGWQAMVNEYARRTTSQ
jgi:hypothetical protein